MRTKIKKVWRTIRVSDEDYARIQKFAKVRKMSLTEIISLLIHQNV